MAHWITVANMHGVAKVRTHADGPVSTAMHWCPDWKCQNIHTSSALVLHLGWCRTRENLLLTPFWPEFIEMGSTGGKEEVISLPTSTLPQPYDLARPDPPLVRAFLSTMHFW